MSQQPAEAAANLRAVDAAFAAWRSGRGSVFDLLMDEAAVTIAGSSPHSGTFGKAAFLSERMAPFAARFDGPLLPVEWKAWAVDDQVFVRWESRATARDGVPYANSYAFFITMEGGRVTALTMFLDMGAFDDVWTRCSPAVELQGASQ